MHCKKSGNYSSNEIPWSDEGVIATINPLITILIAIMSLELAHLISIMFLLPQPYPIQPFTFEFDITFPFMIYMLMNLVGQIRKDMGKFGNAYRPHHCIYLATPETCFIHTRVTLDRHIMLSFYCHQLHVQCKCCNYVCMCYTYM